MLDTTEAAMMEANDFQDSSGVLLLSEKCDIPLTITHSMFMLWAAANSPVSGKKNQSKDDSSTGLLLMLYLKLCPILCEQESTVKL